MCLVVNVNKSVEKYNAFDEVRNIFCTTLFTFSKEKKNLEWFENLNLCGKVDQKWVKCIF